MRERDTKMRSYKNHKSELETLKKMWNPILKVLSTSKFMYDYKKEYS